MKNFMGQRSRATRMGHRIAPPIVPPTPVVVTAKLSPVPSPFTLHPCSAAGTFSRLASKRRTHVILTSGERRFQSSPRGRRRDPFTIHPVGFVDSELLLGIFSEVI